MKSAEKRRGFCCASLQGERETPMDASMQIARRENRVHRILRMQTGPDRRVKITTWRGQYFVSMEIIFIKIRDDLF
jgi:hypothetical protein